MINAPALVLTAAGISAIGRGGVVKHPDPKNEGPSYTQAETFKFWGAVLGASAGIILVDRWNSELAAGLASLWLVGAVLQNGATVTKWLGGFASGVSGK